MNKVSKTISLTPVEIDEIEKQQHFNKCKSFSDYILKVVHGELPNMKLQRNIDKITGKNPVNKNTLTKKKGTKQ